MTNRHIHIGDRTIGAGHPVYIVAELSANHHQDYNQAVELIRAARDAGADAVKLQTYTADTMTIDCENDNFRIGKGTIWEGRSLYELYEEAHTPWEWQPKLKSVAESLGLDLFSTLFDETSVDFLEDMDVCVYKIASFELVDIPLIQRVARTGKPMIMSTGMSTLAEIDEAVSVARQSGATEIALLKCTSAYPALPKDMNLRTIPHLAEGFGVPVGLSDHSLGMAVPVAAVALGACIIEKHFTLSRATPGPDSAFSLEPEEFTAMAKTIRMAEQAVGTVTYQPSEAEFACRAYRRSLFAVKDINAGERLTADNVRSIRPALGMHTRYMKNILGAKAKRDIQRGTPLTFDVLDLHD